MISRSLYYFFLVLFIFEIFSLLPASSMNHAEPSPWLKGFFGVHTRDQRGAGTREEAIAAAAIRGADFLIFNEAAEAPAFAPSRPDSKPLLVLSETEVQTPSGFLTVFHSQTSTRDLNQKAIAKLGYEHFLGIATVPGLFVSVSRPSHRQTPWTQLERFPDGIEIVNFDSQFQRQAYESPFSTFATLALAPLNAFLASVRFQQIYPKDLSSWDAMNSVSPGHFGLLASDARPLIDRESIRWTWPDYSSVFALGSNRVFLKQPLSSDATVAQSQIYRAIQRGNLAVSFDNVYPFEGNDFFLQCGTNEFRPGDRILPPATCQFVVRFPKDLPYRRTVKLIKDGELDSEVTTGDSFLSFPLGLPGTYRVEVWADLSTKFHLLLRRPVPYVFYNPVYVR